MVACVDFSLEIHFHPVLAAIVHLFGRTQNVIKSCRRSRVGPVFEPFTIGIESRLLAWTKSLASRRNRSGGICGTQQIKGCLGACLRLCWTPGTGTTPSWSICCAHCRRAGSRSGRWRAAHPSRNCSHTSTTCDLCLSSRTL